MEFISSICCEKNIIPNSYFNNWPFDNKINMIIAMKANQFNYKKLFIHYVNNYYTKRNFIVEHNINNTETPILKGFLNINDAIDYYNTINIK